MSIGLIRRAAVVVLVVGALGATPRSASAQGVGAWNPTTSLPGPRGSHGTVEHNGYIYVTGGTSDNVGTVYDNVWYAPINPDGTLSAWAATIPFSGQRQCHSSVVWNDRLYVIGGNQGPNNDSPGPLYNDVQFAPINADGTVGAWTTTTVLPAARRRHASVAYNGYVYVVGGQNAGGVLASVLYAAINPDGTVGPWSTTTSFATARGLHSAVAQSGYLYVMGGWPGVGNDVQYAPINPDGTLGPWAATTSFSGGRYGHPSVVACGDSLYIIGGNGPYNDVQYTEINPDGTVGVWVTTTPFATPRYYHTSVAYNGFLYVIAGGVSLPVYTDVQYAPIDCSPPVAGVVRDGLAADIDVQTFLTTISAN